MYFSFEAIGVVHSCFKEKFGIPRQPGLVTEAKGIIEFFPPYGTPEALAGLDGFSHLWVIFAFHGVAADKWRPTVRPPRLGGNRRCGVFASRSTHRPNLLGMSVVKLESIEILSTGCRLHISGLDILDQTPVLDIKPYLKYADAIDHARSGYAHERPSDDVQVHFSSLASQTLDAMPQLDGMTFRKLLEQILSYDPRPAYQHDTSGREYGMRIANYNIRWRYEQHEPFVICIEPVTEP